MRNISAFVANVRLHLPHNHLNKGGKLLPPDFRPAYVNNYSLIQGSIDYIAGMMDTFAISEYERLFNVKFSDIVIKNK